VTPPLPVVYKFGGSSIADAGLIAHVARLVKAGPERLCVVVSALGGVTDQLASLADRPAPDAIDAIIRALLERHLLAAEDLGLNESGLRDLIRERLERLRETAARGPSADVAAVRDEVLSAGEDLSALIVTAAIEVAGRQARRVDARDLVITNERFGAAIPQQAATRQACTERLTPVLAGGEVAVVQGFVGATVDGRTTTLGRGGSDFTAAILAGAVDAEVAHIWTDVAGIMSGDPGEVDTPHLLHEVGFEEAVELSWAGARVIHPVAAKWAVSQGVPLRIRDTFHPEALGTLIRNDVRGVAEIAAVSAKKKVALIKVRSHPVALPYGFLARVFDILGEHRLEVDLVATSHSSTAFTMDESAEIDQVALELSAFADVEVIRELVTITVVGRGLMEEPGLGARVFLEAEHTPIHLISQASDVSLSFVVNRADAAALLRRLHRELIELSEAAARRSA
jgi:aspartate kinase